MDWSAGGRGSNYLTDAETEALQTMERSSRDRDDPSYQRPLTIRPDRLPLATRIVEERRARRLSSIASSMLDYE